MATRRSSLVAVTIHTSTGSSRGAPSRRTIRSSRTLSSLAWSASGNSPTSSRQIVPPCAASSSARGPLVLGGCPPPGGLPGSPSSRSLFWGSSLWPPPVRGPPAVSQQYGPTTSEDAMTESWSTRWYTPLVVIGVALLVLMILALAIVEVLVASAPPVVTPSGWATPLGRADDALRHGDGP